MSSQCHYLITVTAGSLDVAAERAAEVARDYMSERNYRYEIDGPISLEFKSMKSKIGHYYADDSIGDQWLYWFDLTWGGESLR